MIEVLVLNYFFHSFLAIEPTKVITFLKKK